MPTRPIPQSFWLLFVFGLLVAGIVALAGFAIDKGAARDQRPAVAAANEAAAELISGGLFEVDEDDPALALLAADTAPPTSPPDSGIDDQPPPTGEPDPGRGQELFFTNGCNICHGDTGQGGIGPTIASTGLPLAQVLDQYRNPRELMPQFQPDRVQDAAVADIYAWLQTLSLPDEIVPGLGTP